jgi:hypothetical protein
MFPNGWPGTGLLLLRLVSGALLIHQGLIAPAWVAIQPVAALAGGFLIASFWTPVAVDNLFFGRRRFDVLKS